MTHSWDPADVLAEDLVGLWDIGSFADGDLPVWDTATETFLPGASGGGTGVTVTALSPTADTYINQQLATTNFGSSTVLWIGERLDSSGSFCRSALFEFDISSISGDVVSAHLRLTRDEAVPATALSSTNRLIARRVKRAFVASQATWNIYSTGNNWQTAGCRGANDVETTAYTCALVHGDRDQDVWRLDLTEMLKDAIAAGDTTLRFQLGWALTTVGQNKVDVASVDNATATKRPLLTIATS